LQAQGLDGKAATGAGRTSVRLAGAAITPVGEFRIGAIPFPLPRIARESPHRRANLRENAGIGPFGKK
jgi:hypothetical protein